MSRLALRSDAPLSCPSESPDAERIPCAAAVRVLNRFRGLTSASPFVVLRALYRTRDEKKFVLFRRFVGFV